MAIIKSNATAELTRDAVVLDLGDIAQQAQQIRVSAEARARQMLADAQHQAQAQTARVLEEARQAGHKQGYDAGLAEGTKAGHDEALATTADALTKLEKKWSATIGDFDASRDALDRDARQAVLALALKLAEKVVHRVIETDPTVVQDQITAALAHVLRPMDVTVHVHPEDRPVVDEAMPNLTAQWRDLKHVQVVDDETVDRGGCVISSGQGQVDARIDTQLRRIAELLVPNTSAT